MFEELEYIKDLSINELVDIIKGIIGFEETSAALIELEERDSQKTLELGVEILEADKGDDYLQATTWDIIIDIDAKQTVNSMDRRKNKIGKTLLKEMISYLANDYYIQDLSIVPLNLVNRVLRGYDSLNEIDKREINDDYIEFRERFISK